MKANVGGIDRIARIVVGLLLLQLPLDAAGGAGLEPAPRRGQCNAGATARVLPVASRPVSGHGAAAWSRMRGRRAGRLPPQSGAEGPDGRGRA